MIEGPWLNTIVGVYAGQAGGGKPQPYQPQASKLNFVKMALPGSVVS